MRQRIDELSKTAADSIPKDKFSINEWLQEYNREFAHLVLTEAFAKMQEINYINVPDWYERRVREHFGL